MFKNNLRQLRLQKELTQEQLSKKLGLSPSSIGNYEQGTRFPKYETLEKMADFFNINISDLFITDNQIILTDKDKKFLELFKQLTDDEKKLLMTTAESIIKTYHK